MRGSDARGTAKTAGYHLEHPFHICQHIVVPKAQDEETRAFYGSASRFIGLVPVLAAIKLDNQLCLQAQKIGDVPANRRLPAKLEAKDLAISQSLPQ